VDGRRASRGGRYSGTPLSGTIVGVCVSPAAPQETPPQYRIDWKFFFPNSLSLMMLPGPAALQYAPLQWLVVAPQQRACRVMVQSEFSWMSGTKMNLVPSVDCRTEKCRRTVSRMRTSGHRKTALKVIVTFVGSGIGSLTKWLCGSTPHSRATGVPGGNSAIGPRITIPFWTRLRTHKVDSQGERFVIQGFRRGTDHGSRSFLARRAAVCTSLALSSERHAGQAAGR
jgi:hypothetical protein